MAMSIGDSTVNMSNINVTPMIDILLVLLIIFMVIAPVTPKGLDALIPQPPQDRVSTPPERTIVVQVSRSPEGTPFYKINETNVSHADLLSKLTAIYANRAERVMFVKGDDNVDFAFVADVIDIGRAANVDHLGLMTPKLTSGQ